MAGTAVYFDSSLSSDDGVRALLGALPDDSSHPSCEAAGKLVVKRAGGAFDLVDVAGAAQYTSAVDLDSLQDSFAGYFRSFPCLESAAPYEVQIESAPFSASAVSPAFKWQAVCFSNRSSTSDGYFDFEVISARVPAASDLRIAYYSGNSDVVRHTGDLLQYDALMHGAEFVSADPGVTHFLCCVGYRNQLLRTFIHQAPSVAFIDPDARAVRIIPCSLAENDIGDAVFTVVAVVTFDPALGRWNVVPVSGCNASGGGIDTGRMCPAMREAVRLAHARSLERPDLRPAPAPTPAPAAAPAADPLDYGVTMFLETGLDAPVGMFPGVEFTCVVRFGASSRGSPDDAPSVRLPCIFGPCNPCANNALGRAPRAPFTWPAFRAGLESARLVVVVVSRHWLQTVACAAAWAGNVVFVLQDDRAGDPAALAGSFNRTAAVMAGGCSLVLYRSVSGRLLCYRCVPWSGLLDVVPDFGTDVTDLLGEAMPGFVAGGGMAALRFPKTVALGCDPVVYLGGRAVDPSRLSVDDAVGDAESFKSACVQLSAALSPQALRAAGDALMAHINQWADARLAAIREETASLRARDVLNDPDARTQLAQLVGRRRLVTRAVGPLVAAVQAMHSGRGASTRDADLNRANRSAVTRARVAKAQGMSPDEIADMFAGVDEWLLANVDSAACLESLRMCHEGVFLESRSAGRRPAVASPHPSCSCIDGCTAAALRELASRDHFLASETPVAVRSGLNTTQSALPLPLLERFASMSHPGAVHWPDTASEEEVCAAWRILTLGNLASCAPGRQYGMAPTNPELPFALVAIIFDVLEALTGMVSDLSNLEAGDTLVRTCRALLGLVLSILASGAERPRSLLWQMVKPGASLDVPPHGEIWIAVAILRVMPYTLWPMDAVRAKTAQLLAKTVRRGVVDPVVEPLRRQVAQMEAEASRDYLRARDVQLAFMGTVWGVVRDLVESDRACPEHEADFAPVASRLLAAAPAEALAPATKKIRAALGRVVRFLRAAAAERVDWGAPFERTLRSLAKAHVTRSAAFKAGKRALKAARDAGDDEAAADATRDLRAARDLLRFVPGGARVQFWRAVEDPALSLAGDAELVRTAWSVTGDEGAAARVDAAVAAALLAGGRPVSAAVASPVSAAVAAPVSAAVASLQPCGPRAERALALAATAPHLSTDMVLQMAGLGPHVAAQYQEMGRRMGWGDRGGAVVETMLANWRDPVAGETAAVLALVANA
eukprot:jgi/Tetstr1/454077/TSEL_040996.t1